MKKIITLLCIALLLTLTGCSQDKAFASNEKVISQEEFKNCFNIVDITLDNWQDYFEIKDYEENGSKYKIIIPKEETTNNLCASPSVKFTYDIKGKERNEAVYVETGESAYDQEWSKYNRTGNTTTVYFSRDYSEPQESAYYYPVLLCYYNDYGTREYWTGKEVHEAWIIDVESIDFTAVEGSLCYANYPDDVWNTNGYGEKYLRFENENGVLISVYDNGLLRWDKGSGFGYSNNKSLYSIDYYTFFED